MPKKISSPSSRWPGAVHFADPMNMSQALAWARAQRELNKYRVIVPVINEKGEETFPFRDDLLWEELHAALLPGIFACIDKWELEGFPDPVDISNFPASPARERSILVAWLIGEVTSIYAGTAEVEDPNE